MADLTIAASEDAFRELFNGLRDNFSFSHSDSNDFGPFSVSYAVGCHLEGGSVDLRNDNTVRIRELDILWDTLNVTLGLDIPEICIGGWCIIPTPFGCAVRLPRICIFSADPDISVPINLDGLLRSELSATASPVVDYFVDPLRTAAMDDWDADDAGVPNKWQVFIDPESVDIDIFDFADIVGDILEDALTAAIEALIPGSGIIEDAILAVLGPIIDVIRAILDIPDDIGEWLADLLGFSFGLLNLIATFIADYFASENPIYELEDPVNVLPATGTLVAVKSHLRTLSAIVNTDELVISADVAAA